MGCKIMLVVFSAVKPIILKIATHPQVKLLVVQLLEKYVKSTDNSVDDAILETVKLALFKDQITGEISEIGKKLLG